MTDTRPPTTPDWLRAELGRADHAAAQGAVRDAAHLQATAARYDARHKRVVVELANGSQFAFPPALAQGLEHARAADLAEIEITPLGTGLHWPRLDADLSVEGLLSGLFGSRTWMRQHAARAGRATSAAKAQAARANGAKGGRPRKASA
ncbi:Protein of unknown function [Oryzisolibacter propanilivorax]|uniref:DUF2442 domain-containing protein n=1 Tax=Oryzisolibacter propanilivorax TaxID=1527607 RepID=A0A1G9RRX0_9BURK|nr:DUF2442 domain-containing protein [Oryzisolibacter propanilivorax]SDM25892.1 Protein of unknown function [Oryzisolibacter propanilivorax]